MTIRSVDWAKEAPGLWQKLTHCSSFHLGEILTTMDATEMRQITMIVQFICNNSIAGGLHQIET